MAGSVEIPRTIRRADIRRDGRLLGYRGEELEDFFLIIRQIDKFFVRHESKKVSEDLKRRARKKPKQR